ncbi:hypothetical protein D9619_005683 [Psilocybe cf. subviscida]|uniref:DUF974-domain-containing protein n=1 Tax=Psilocybe cf. subviscida TaxID=2480587 RepID=A0A8H5FB55_9AGAR|nr:hypothetical protein D9619_005683 [Psilocybe cf. subviscida]
MAATDGPAHLLSLKVMRISRPELASAWQPFYSSSPSFSAHSSASIQSLQGALPLPGHPKTLRDLTHASELLTLPSSFGSIQLGETFSSCLCINNDVEIGVEVTQTRVEMQTATTKVTLYESEGANTVSPGDTLERIVHHEIKELGQHVLACTVTYRLPPHSRPVPGAAEDASDPSLQTFRKFYKFAVTNPLSVKTKVHAPKSATALLCPPEREKIFLEVHIQNLTQDTLTFERMRLECTDGWTATDVNMIPSGDTEESIFSGAMAVMQPQDMRQYVYVLQPKTVNLSPTSHAPGAIIPLGRLDISWRSSFGEPGRLLTSMLSRRLPLAPAPLPASAVPPHLKRTVGSTPSRPQSPSIGHERPGTPPLTQRPGSPAVGRPAAAISTQVHSALPELEASLIVRHVPKGNLVEKPFKMSLAVVVSSSLPPAGREHSRRKVKLAVQHVSHKNIPALPPPLPAAAVQEAFSPRLPSSSGFSTPSSSTTTFNYALAHQKILAASSRPPQSEPALQEVDLSNADNNVLPPPYFEPGASDPKPAGSGGIAFVGPSAVFFPPIELDFADQDSQIKIGDSVKVQAVQEFDLNFVALRKGFATIGGLRILLIDDQLVGNTESIAEGPKDGRKRASILKEYAVIGETWISA